MIDHIVRGHSTVGLLAYLFGPGKSERAPHTDAHMVASWDGLPSALEPGPGRTTGRAVTRLARILELPLAARERHPEQYVWHCSLRNAPGDRRLSDAEWAQVAAEVMDATGIARHGDAGGCRWVAVRHADDHIHLAAVLARQDGRAVGLYKDWTKTRAVCVAAEQRLELTATAPADGTAARSPTRREWNDAQQPGRPRAETPREQLRRRVGLVAGEVTDSEAFLQRLAATGLLVHPRRGQHGELTGYAVALAGHTDEHGDLVRYSGGKLAPDLTLPKLEARWAAGDAAAPVPARRPARLKALADAAQTTRKAAAALADGQDGDSTAHAAGELLGAAARIVEGRAGGGRLHQAADVYDAATRAPHRPVPAPDAAGRALRQAARRLMSVRRIAGHEEQAGAVELVEACVVLVVAVADAHAAHRRAAAAAAARQTAEQLRAALPALTPPPAPAVALGRRAARAPAPAPSPRSRGCGARFPRNRLLATRRAPRAP